MVGATGSGNRSAPSSVAPPGDLVESSSRWIRVKCGTVLLADSKRTLLLREYAPGRLPTYYFPEEDVRMDLLERMPDQPSADGMIRFNVNTASTIVENAARMYVDPPPDRAGLRGYVTFSWNRGLTWLEEEEEVFVHARDPHKRVDVLRSSREVKVVIGGEMVAETRQPTLLFETSLPTRYYLPAEDVRMQFLEPAATTTRCPYKGIATYWSARVGDTFEKDVVWTYREPIQENPKIKDLICFFNERVDLYVDGELQARPQTPWTTEDKDRIRRDDGRPRRPDPLPSALCFKGGVMRPVPDDVACRIRRPRFPARSLHRQLRTEPAVPHRATPRLGQRPLPAAAVGEQKRQGNGKDRARLVEQQQSSLYPASLRP